MFKAIPSWLKKGTLKGIRLPNTIKVERFTWDIPNHTFELELTSKRSNTLTIQLPDVFKPIEEDTPSFIEVNLKANEPVRIPSKQ
ncbi:hypothetical protein [Alkalibacterium sp. m-11]